jgi:hypothetical protein
MDKVEDQIEVVELLYAIEGHPKPFAASIGPATTVLEFIQIAAQKDQITETVELYLENAEEPLGGELVLVEQLTATFAPVHLAKPGKIKTTVEYNLKTIERAFRPGVTIARILEWAVGKNGFGLDKPAADFQLKHHGEVLSLDDHLGQVSGGHKEIALHLVFKMKPQG